MQTYNITYTNKKGHDVTTKSKGNTAIDAVQRYGRRLVFGGDPIFGGAITLKTCDTDTYGKNCCVAAVDIFDGTGETFDVYAALV